MTPQERELIKDLFDRLESLEDQPRDKDAEREIAKGVKRAPHAVYALVQTVLVQDEALQMAEQRIRELGGIEGQPQQRGFLDSVRETLLGPDPQRRGSVPEVRPGSAWSQPQPMQPVPEQGRPSFLGTAAATAAGVIGGSLLFNMLSGGKAHAGNQGVGDFGRGDSPWGSGGARDSDLARDAGINDIGRAQGSQHAWFDPAQPDQADDGMSDDFDFGGDGGGDGGGGGD